uniref:JmjC domain-containing protein n=1 Tax=Megaselia scalaris TaxID=36166 RepID=T1H200_MEGSC
MCKIVPPSEWLPRRIPYNINDMDFSIKTPTEQVFKQKSNGVYKLKNQIIDKLSLVQFKDMTYLKKYKPPKFSSFEEIESLYWEEISNKNAVHPIYAADIQMTLMDFNLKYWNLNSLNSILDLVDKEYWIDIDGLWYVIPPSYGKQFESLLKKLYPKEFEECSSFMRHKTIMVHHSILKKHGIPYNTVLQEAGDIIITFPFAYHCGFNLGFNAAESTNFATERWIEYGKRTKFCKCFVDTVKISMQIFVQRFQPDKYEAWLSGKDYGSHPEEPDVICPANKATINIYVNK